MERLSIRVFVWAATIAMVAVGVAVLLLHSYDAAILVLLVVIPAGLFFFEPFLGLIVYTLYFYIRPHEFVSALHGGRTMLIVESTAFASALVKITLTRGRFRLFNSPQDKLMWWFVAAIALSHLSQFKFDAAIGALFSFMNVLVFYFLITNLVDSERRLRVFSGVLVFLTLVLAVQGIVQYYLGSGLAGQTVGDEGRIQSLGGFANPNALAMALLVGLAFCYYDIVATRNKLGRFYCLAAAVTIFVAIYLTNSRGTMLALGALATILLVRRAGWKNGLAASAVVFVLILVFGPSRMSTISPTEPSAYGRIVAWNTGLEFLKSRPFFGIGAEAWGSEYAAMVAHNSLVHCAAELGMFGLLPWVMLIFISMKNVRFVSRASVEVPGSGLRVEADKILLAGLAYVFTSMFISKTYSPLLYVIVALSCAAVNVFTDHRGERFELWERKDLVYSAMITIGGLLVIAIFVALVGV